MKVAVKMAVKKAMVPFLIIGLLTIAAACGEKKGKSSGKTALPGTAPAVRPQPGVAPQGHVPGLPQGTSTPHDPVFSDAAQFLVKGQSGAYLAVELQIKEGQGVAVLSGLMADNSSSSLRLVAPPSGNHINPIGPTLGGGQQRLPPFNQSAMRQQGAPLAAPAGMPGMISPGIVPGGPLGHVGGNDPRGLEPVAEIQSYAGTEIVVAAYSLALQAQVRLFIFAQASNGTYVLQNARLLLPAKGALGRFHTLIGDVIQIRGISEIAAFAIVLATVRDRPGISFSDLEELVLNPNHQPGVEVSCLSGSCPVPAGNVNEKPLVVRKEQVVGQSTVFVPPAQTYPQPPAAAAVPAKAETAKPVVPAPKPVIPRFPGFKRGVCG